jgi:hypothetical protein
MPTHEHVDIMHNRGDGSQPVDSRALSLVTAPIKGILVGHYSRRVAGTPRPSSRDDDLGDPPLNLGL